jgi:CRISPR-associated protein Cmr3
VDVRLAIDPTTWTAREGALFAAETVEMLGWREGLPWEWAILVEASLPRDAAIESLPAALGGDRRIARIEPLDPSLLGVPSAGPDEPPCWRDSPGLRLLLVTPAVFEEGWLPDGFRARDGAFRGLLPGVDGEVVLRAAFVPRSIAVSSWDMAENRPRPGLRAVPPGAVYFFHKADGGASFTPQEMKNLWLASLGAKTGEGFGRAVAGPWMRGAPARRTEEST